MTGFQKGVRIATIAGIPIYLHVSWFVIFGLVAWSLSQGYFPARYPELPVATYWVKGLTASLLLFASVLAHELDHSVVARRQMAGLGSGRLLVRDAGRCVGMVNHSDILRRWQVARALGEG